MMEQEEALPEYCSARCSVPVECTPETGDDCVQRKALYHGDVACEELMNMFLAI